MNPVRAAFYAVSLLREPVFFFFFFEMLVPSGVSGGVSSELVYIL